MAAAEKGLPAGASAVKFARIHGNTSGDNTLVAAVTGKKILVLAMALYAAGNVNVTIESGAGGTEISGPYTILVANHPCVILPFCPVGHFHSAAAVLLNMSLSDAVYVSGHLVYVEID